MQPFRVSADSPGLNADAERTASVLRRATFWLTPKSVDGYDPNDFDFLPDEERERLTERVRQFREAASKAPDNAPATDEQIRDAMPKFDGVLEIVRPDKYADLDSFIVGKKIEREVSGKLPEWVRGLFFETGFDVSEEPALWIWVEVDDKALDEKEILRRFDSVREELRTAASRICPERWPFIRLRETSEREASEGAKTTKRSQKAKR